MKSSLLADLFAVTPQAINNWKKDQNKKILPMLEKYFYDEDLIEFIENGTISRLENKSVQGEDQRNTIISLFEVLSLNEKIVLKECISEFEGSNINDFLKTVKDKKYNVLEILSKKGQKNLSEAIENLFNKNDISFILLNKKFSTLALERLIEKDKIIKSKL